MNIKKKIIFTGFSLLLSNTFNSAYSADGAEKNLDDAINLSPEQPFHTNYLDLNQLQRLAPIDGDTAINDSTTFTLFDDDPLQQENSSVSSGNEEDFDFDLCFSEEESDTERRSDTLDLNRFLESSDSEEDFNQELFELLANSILTQDIGIILPDAADTAQPSAQPLEKAGRKARTKKMGRSVQEIEARNKAIKEFIVQHKTQNPSTKLTYPKILEGLQPQYPDLTFPQIRRILEINPSLRTYKNSQEEKERIQERKEAIRQFILQHKEQNPSTKLTYAEILEGLQPQYRDLTFPQIRYFFHKNKSFQTSKRSQEDKERIQERNEAIRQFILQHNAQNPSTNLTYPKILEGLQPQYPDLTLRQIAYFFEINTSLRTSKRSQEDKERIQERNEAIRQFILQHKAQNPSTNLTYPKILEGLQPQYPDLTLPQIMHFLENNPSLRTSKNSQKKQIAPAADDESLSELSDLGDGQSAISAEKDSLVPNSSDAADTAQPSAQPLEKAERKASTKTMRRSAQEIEARNEAIRAFCKNKIAEGIN
jgi:type II secretory pathway pseudopilin PulG